MRTTINLDDALLKEATQLTGIIEKPRLVHEALETLIRKEKARRLAALGGTEKRLKPIPRRSVSS
jgi:Arc/MetJ family transcription regulator